jgi:hypothetical protein
VIFAPQFGQKLACGWTGVPQFVQSRVGVDKGIVSCATVRLLKAAFSH